MIDNETLQNEQAEGTKKKVKSTAKKEPTLEHEVKMEKDKNTNERKVLIYLGPNLLGGILNHGAVGKGYPKYLAETFERLPDVKKLFVGIDDIVRFKEALNKKGSEESRLYQQALSSMREEAKHGRL